MLNRDEILNLLQSEYREVKGDQRLLREDDDITTLAIDSLQVVELIHILEEEIGVELLGDPRLQRVKTVRDLVDLAVSVQPVA